MSIPKNLNIAHGDILLGKYRVERVLGIGGMGAVLAVRHLELEQLFALKLLLPEAMASQGAVDRFLREARAAARLQSDHVGKVHDVGRLESGMPYMLMEYLRGQDLKETLKRHGPLPLATAVTYILQAIEAIGEAHAAGIVHRDLKPANLFLITKPSGAPCVKVLDFGISKQASGAESGMDMTKTSTVLGSPYYMSPEQMMSTKHVDSRTDIWALGVILYELVTGIRPFVAETILELAGRVFNEEPRLPSACRSDLPPAFDAIIMRCLQKRPDERFASVTDLATALAALAHDNPSRVSSLPAGVAEGRGSVQPAPEVVMSVGIPAPVPPQPVPVSSDALAATPPSDARPSTAPEGWGRTGHRVASRAGPRPVVLALVGTLGVLVGGVYAYLQMHAQPNVSEPEASPTTPAQQPESHQQESPATSIGTVLPSSGSASQNDEPPGTTPRNRTDQRPPVAANTKPAASGPKGSASSPQHSATVPAPSGTVNGSNAAGPSVTAVPSTSASTGNRKRQGIY